MADTFTTNLNLTKPEVGASTDTWGTKLNTDLDSLDAVFSATGTSVAINLDGAVIDSSVIGGTTPAAGTFTAFTSTGIDDNATSTAITIDSSENSTFSGNINLDLATPTVIFKESGAAKFFIGESSGVGGGSGFYDLYAAAGLGLRFFTAAAERMRINSSGNVGIGTSPDFRLHVSGTGSVLGLNATSGAVSQRFNENGTARFFLSTLDGSNGLAFVNGDGTSERMRINSSGNLLVGATSFPNYGTLNSYSNSGAAAGRFLGGASMPDGSAVAAFDKNSATTTASQIFVVFTISNQTVGSGQINANGASQAAFGSFSDARLKQNIVDLDSQWENIKALRPVEFDYIESEGGGHQIGFIAQEIEPVYPDLVGERADGMFTLSGMGKNEARLIKALQEAITKIEDLTTRLETLENA